ncbi:hypothetical protein JRC04_24845, partial [Mycolicibacterium sp. S2-37]|uniref:hypothetical protein n=1 Tax=Mycolicibacterium sp. S2-37 TaxID=2810297 RepID=UPI001A94127C
PESNSPNKTSKGNQENPITTRQKSGKKTTPPKREKEGAAQQKQQTKTTKHTIEFSNNTPARPAQRSRGQKPRSRRADGQEPTEADFPLGVCRAPRSGDRVAAT